MRWIGDFISQNFVVAEPYQKADVFIEILANGKAVVVMEENHFLGLLSLKDVLLQPGKVVIEALSPKPRVNGSEEIFHVLLSMYENDFEFLAVETSGVFEGVISRKFLSTKYIGYLAQHDRTGEVVLNLQNELAFKNKFISIFSHDIRNMFNQVLGSIEVLDKRLANHPDQRTQAILQLTRRSAQQVYSTFEGMLLWSRMDSGTIVFKPLTLSLKDIFSMTVSQFQLAADVKNIRIINLLEDDIYLYADPNMLNCILLNLVSNGIKFTPSEGSIWLNARYTEDYTELVVSDSGRGMTYQQKQELFKEGRSTTGTSNETGAGIGLVICKDFVEKHGGKMQVASEQGEGTRVSVFIPNVRKTAGLDNGK